MKERKERKQFSKLYKFLYCFVRPRDPPWCKTLLFRGPAHSNSHVLPEERERNLEFGTVVYPESYRITLKYSLDQVMWFRIFCSWTAFISGYWSGSRMIGENRHHHRLVRCKGARAKGGSPASAQHSTRAISGQNMRHHYVAHTERD